MAGIRQRIGLDVHGGGFAHTIRVRPTAELHEAELYLALARALGLHGESDTEFYPTDGDRIRVTEWLAGELEWLGDVPLAVLHPGGGSNPVSPDPQKQWPVERFALLGNQLVREHGARILVVGAAGDTPLVNAVVGLMSAPAHNLAGKLSLGELGALAEVANLYVGNDTGPTHVAAAMGCPTLALFGPSDVKLSRPYTRRGHVIAMPALKHVMERAGTTTPAFSWKGNLSADEVIVAAEQLLSSATAAKSGAGESLN
jgi:ADP-heptose:LPS heptosyltransferase